MPLLQLSTSSWCSITPVSEDLAYVVSELSLHASAFLHLLGNNANYPLFFILPVSIVLSHVQEGEVNFAYVATRLGNIVPRLSLHCLPLPLGERSYLRLVTWLPRVRVVEKIVWGEGWHGILIIVVGFKTSSRYPLCRGSKQVLQFCNATLFLPSPKYRKILITKKFRIRMELKIFDCQDM